MIECQTNSIDSFGVIMSTFFSSRKCHTADGVIYFAVSLPGRYCTTVYRVGTLSLINSKLKRFRDSEILLRLFNCRQMCQPSDSVLFRQLIPISDVVEWNPFIIAFDAFFASLGCRDAFAPQHSTIEIYLSNRNGRRRHWSMVTLHLIAFICKGRHAGISVRFL